jgi:hypothetical protein
MPAAQVFFFFFSGPEEGSVGSLPETIVVYPESL